MINPQFGFRFNVETSALCFSPTQFTTQIIFYFSPSKWQSFRFALSRVFICLLFALVLQRLSYFLLFIIHLCTALQWEHFHFASWKVIKYFRGDRRRTREKYFCQISILFSRIFMPRTWGQWSASHRWKNLKSTELSFSLWTVLRSQREIKERVRPNVWAANDFIEHFKSNWSEHCWESHEESRFWFHIFRWKRKATGRMINWRARSVGTGQDCFQHPKLFQAFMEEVQLAPPSAFSPHRLSRKICRKTHFHPRPCASLPVTTWNISFSSSIHHKTSHTSRRSRIQILVAHHIPTVDDKQPSTLTTSHVQRRLSQKFCLVVQRRFDLPAQFNHSDGGGKIKVSVFAYLFRLH